MIAPSLTAPAAHAEPVTGLLGKVRDGRWYGAHIPTTGGARLYADVLLPARRSGRVPVVLAMGPYFQHYSPRSGGRQPADRYNDLIEGARLLKRGYAVVFVDLRGFGGSTGCPDNSGPVDRSDIRTAVRWAATRKWSSGRVAMYGKSYDGVTGLIAAGMRIPGLAGVVAQEPVYDWYRYLYGNGVPRTTRSRTPLSLIYTSVNPPPTNFNDLQFREYAARSAANIVNPTCNLAALAAQQNASPDDRYWKHRRILEPLSGSTVPIFLSQGFIDQNTAADGLAEALRYHSGPVNGWLGMWDHVRGNDTDRTTMMGAATDRSSTGRRDFLVQVAQFFDRHLKNEGAAPTGFYVQDNTGAWRTQPSWPLRSAVRKVELRTGTYRHDGKQVATKVRVRGRWLATQVDAVPAGAQLAQDTEDDSANGVWTMLPPEATAARISGAPWVTVNTRVRNNSSDPLVQKTPVAVDVYDVDPAGRATLITQNVGMLAPGSTRLRLYATDWLVRAGHRIAIRITDSNRGRWEYPVSPNNAAVTVVSGEALLPLAPINAGTPTTGSSNTSLEGYLHRYRYPVPRR
ncbi:putative hydrolase [Gordonia araii NBRC 100433]|uniref:Putative hydrolase n=2 Tax=Gordonia araii TaxID=263909 RepID=G7H083_9ACTN|nr:putative hydrolase [Gordonia araii NBRC 100433]